MLTRPGVKGGYLEANNNNLPDFTVAMCIHEDNTFLFVLKKLFHPKYGALFQNSCRNKQKKSTSTIMQWTIIVNQPSTQC